MTDDIRLVDVHGQPLRLTPKADVIAKDVYRLFGGAVVIFTSGRRTRYAQAKAMATNITLRGRDWLTRTYKPSPVRDSLEEWLRANAWARKVDDITVGFANVLEGFSDKALRSLSLHFSGEAWDLQPREGPSGEELHDHLSARTDIKFLDREGGLIRWHCQLRHPEGV